MLQVRTAEPFFPRSSAVRQPCNRKQDMQIIVHKTVGIAAALGFSALAFAVTLV